MNVFDASAAELRMIQERVNTAFKKWRLEGDETQKVAWMQAAQEFRDRYDQLSFPGGMSVEFTRLNAGDPTAIEMAVRYLEADPWYFRSGYTKVDMIKVLCKQTLTEEQCARLREVILQRVHGRTVREMRAYCRLASKVTSAEFETELRGIAQHSDRDAVRHANWVLDYLKAWRSQKDD